MQLLLRLLSPLLLLLALPSAPASGLTSTSTDPAPPIVPDDLLEVPLAPLPGGAAYPGLTIALGSLSTPSNIKFEPSSWAGHSGLHFKGTDPLVRTKMQSTGYHTTVALGRNSGFIIFENIEFQTAIADGKRIHVWAGVDAPNKPDFVQATAMFVNCSWTCPDIPSGKYGVWGLFTDQFDIILIDCEFHTQKLYEHAMYWHAFGQLGAYLNGVEVFASGAIGAQLTARPGPMYYTDPAKLAKAKHALPGPEEDWFHPTTGAFVYMKDCTFRDWFQSWSWRGGAGAALQGAGVSMLFEDCRWLDFDDHSSPAVGMTNSGVEHFDPLGVAGDEPSMGDMIFRRCFLYAGPNGNANWPPLVDMSAQGTLSPTIARSVTFEDCGLYGNRRRVTLRQVLNDDITVVGCNTPAIEAEASLVWGMDTTYEAQLHIDGGSFKPASQGH